ncbi:hypothetical protein Leryth_023962 [Lithospermum erythrorhizon]|nr:hypothetical protein Leryth_023962 [Lithospermum erythrorhizon]
MHQFREIETCIECSAFKHIQIQEVFYYAQKAVLHPRCVNALKRIFIICDHDMDGALSDAELNDFQVKCFNAPLQPSEILGVKRVVQEKVLEGVDDRGLTLTGRLETTWTVLRKFGYNNEIRLNDDQLPPPLKKHPDQSVELTNDAVNFLKNVFITYDIDGDGALGSEEIDDLFSTAPENPWEEAPYKDTAEKDVLGGLSLDAFLSQWALMALLDPLRTVENLIYIGYADDPSLAVSFRPAQKAGKSVLLNSYIRRAFSEEYIPTTDDHYAVNVVKQPGGSEYSELDNFIYVSCLQGSKKTLVLREIPERRVKKFLSSKDALAACDVAVFVHDSSSESSWKRASELLVDVASHGEASEYDVSCLIVAAKDDLDSYLTEIQDSTRLSQDMGIEAPIPISTKLGGFSNSNIFQRIVSAAEHPHLSIPETEAGRSRKQYHRLVNRSFMVISVGAAVAVVGMAAYRVYAARKSTSS